MTRTAPPVRVWQSMLPAAAPRSPRGRMASPFLWPAFSTARTHPRQRGLAPPRRCASTATAASADVAARRDCRPIPAGLRRRRGGGFWLATPAPRNPADRIRAAARTTIARRDGRDDRARLLDRAVALAPARASWSRSRAARRKKLEHAEAVVAHAGPTGLVVRCDGGCRVCRRELITAAPTASAHGVTSLGRGGRPAVWSAPRVRQDRRHRLAIAVRAEQCGRTAMTAQDRLR